MPPTFRARKVPLDRISTITAGFILVPRWFYQFRCKPDARVAPFNLREGNPDEVLLDVAAVGLCGSDLHYYKDGGIG
eukprot:gene24976-26967_t